MAMRFPGGAQVEEGYYIDARSFVFANVAKDGDRLPGGPERKFVRVPTLVVMAVAPALGGLFVVALPLIGFGVAAHAVLRALTGGAKEVAATVAAPGMPAGSTALTGKPADERAEGEQGRRGELDALAKEIEEKRRRK